MFILLHKFTVKLAGDGTRTHDLGITNASLCRLSYTGFCHFLLGLEGGVVGGGGGGGAAYKGALISLSLN